VHKEAADGLYIKETKHDTFSWSIIVSYTSDYLGLETVWTAKETG